jgi:hypothetical protein
MATKAVFLSLFACSMLTGGCALQASHGSVGSEHEPRAEVPEALAVVGKANESVDARVGSHGMIVTGTPSHLLLSHIPMFHKPHDVQLILQAKVVGANTLPKSLSEKLHTFVPDLLSLDALRTGKLTEMQGTVYAGNFEDGGTALSRVKVTVTSITHQHVLEATEVAAQPTYFAQGSLNDAIVIHRIAGAPGYDQVIHASLTGVSETQLAAGVVLFSVPSVDAVHTRLQTAQTLTLASKVPVVVTPLAELSCLVGPHFATACP